MFVVNWEKAEVCIVREISSAADLTLLFTLWQGLSHIKPKLPDKWTKRQGFSAIEFDSTELTTLIATPSWHGAHLYDSCFCCVLCVVLCSCVPCALLCSN